MTDQPITKQQMVRARRMARAAGILQGLEAALRPGDLVVDCGANVGSITERMAATGAEVVAFEPDPVAFAELEKATKDLPNVTRHQAAVGVAAGQATLYRGERFDDNPVVATRRSTIMPGANRMQGAAMEVEVVNLPAMLKDWGARAGGVAFLKLDVEGAELDILTDMLRFDLFDTVKLTVAELHGYKFPEIRDEFVALRKVIRARYPDTRVWLDWI